MNNKLSEFTPILLGSDFNVYGMARSFYELTGKPVKAFAEQQLAPTRFTKIVNLELIDGFSNDPKWINSMLEIKERYRNHNEPVILIGCGDGYAELISKHKEELNDVFVCPYIDFNLLKRLNKKESFSSRHRLLLRSQLGKPPPDIASSSSRHSTLTCLVTTLKLNSNGNCNLNKKEE